MDAAICISVWWFVVVAHRHCSARARQRYAWATQCILSDHCMHALRMHHELTRGPSWVYSSKIELLGSESELVGKLNNYACALTFANKLDCTLAHHANTLEPHNYCMHAPTHPLTRSHARGHTRTHARAHTHTRARAYTHTHTHTHTNTQVWALRSSHSRAAEMLFSTEETLPLPHASASSHPAVQEVHVCVGHSVRSWTACLLPRGRQVWPFSLELPSTAWCRRMWRVLVCASW
jgi:hypothetical protein